jgi:hypothetical protein
VNIRTRPFARFARGTGVVLCSCWLGPNGLLAEDAAKPPADAKPADATKEASADSLNETEYRNWIEFGVGALIRSSGDDAAFTRRLQRPSGIYGGISDFHYEEDIGKRGIFKIDGHGIFDAHDYGVRLELSDPEVGFIRAGYSQFRVWYDGSGGYYPGNAQWISLYDEQFTIDRSEAFFEAGLTMPDFAKITFRYLHQEREGLKDSTSWGDTTLTGGKGARNIVPTFSDINERRDSFALDALHTIGNTDLGLGLRYEISSQDNSRNLRRRPGETVTDALGTRSADRHVTQNDAVDLDMLNLHASSETRLRENLLFTLGYSFTTLDTDIRGSRIYGSSYEPVFDPLLASRQQRDEGFLDLGGGSQMNQHVGNLNLMWNPTKDFTVVAAVRIEDQQLDGESDFIETNVGGAPNFTTTTEEIAARSERDILDVSESLELRYTGVKNLVGYVRGFWLQGQGTLDETETVGIPGATDLLRSTDFDRSAQQYTAGVNWYPAPRVSLGGQYYHKIRDEAYAHAVDSTPNRAGNRYPAFLIGQGFVTDDANVRATLRPLNNLTLVSRYDCQFSTVSMRGDGLADQQAAEISSHIFSQSVSWTPWSRLGLQASLNYVLDETDTPADQWLLPSQPVLDSNSDYWFVSGNASFVLDEKTDIQGYYSYYFADNYVDNSAFGQPYGAGAEEHVIGATVSRRINKRVRVSLRYGFVTYHDATAGGHNDFDGHLVYSTLQYLF